VYQPLQDDYRLGTASAAHWRGWDLIGQHAANFEPVVRNHVRTGDRASGDPGQNDAPWGVGAHVMDHRAPNPENAAIAGHRDFNVPVLVTVLVRGKEVLAPVLDPFYRSPQLHRSRDERGVFGIERSLRSEAATDIGRHHPELRLAKVEHVRDRLLVTMAALRGNEEVQRLKRLIPACNRTATLDEKGATAVLEDVLPE